MRITRLSARFSALVLFAALFALPAAAQDGELTGDLPIGGPNDTVERQAPPVADPFEPFNRVMHHVNDKLYHWVLKPTAKGYKAVLPKDPRRGIKNAFANVTTPVRFVNCALQGDLQGAGTELSRFAINSTLGGLGFTDPANKHFGIETRDEDIGQTLGVYGVGTGPYLVLPLFGPLNIRDAVGTVGDSFLNPLNWIGLENAERFGLRANEIINNTSLALGQYEQLKAAAVDPYVALRSGYMKRREKAVKEREQ